MLENIRSYFIQFSSDDAYACDSYVPSYASFSSFAVSEPLAVVHPPRSVQALLMKLQMPTCLHFYLQIPNRENIDSVSYYLSHHSRVVCEYQRVNHLLQRDGPISLLSRSHPLKQPAQTLHSILAFCRLRFLT